MVFMRVVFVLLTMASVQGQEAIGISSSSYNPAQLKESVVMADQKSLAVVGQSKCDAEGSIYFQAVREGIPDNTVILRVDAAKKKLFSMALQDIPELRAAQGGAFALTEDSVFLLAWAYAPKRKPELWIARFSTEGKYKGRILVDPLITSKGFSPRQFAVFRSGEIFLAGRADESIGGKFFERPLTAIFSQEGKFLREVEFQQDGQTKDRLRNLGEYAANGKELPDDVKGAIRSLDLADAQTGVDGNVYMMRYGSPATIYVINVVGELVRTLKIPAPEDGLDASGFGLTNNRIAVRFLDFDGPAKGALYTILNLATEERVLTTDGSKLSRAFACFLPDGNFEILTNRSGKLAVDIVVPR
jgi:hypothetical protein